jgi:hypothetical protein
MDKKMRRSIFAVVAASTLTFCSACQSTSFPPVENVVRIEVRTNSDASIKTITDEQTIMSILAFVNKRSGGWETPWYGVPVPTVVANLHSSSTLLGHFGVGANFFETQRKGGFFSRSATVAERRQFMELLGIPFEKISGSDGR